MKKGLVWIGAMALAAGMLGGCGQKGTDASPASESQAQSETAQEGVTEEQRVSTEDITTFTVGFDAEFPPYGYRDGNKEYAGFDLDLAEEVCARNGWELIRQPIDWADRDAELSSGVIDCIWNGFTMNGREDKYTWSEPYVDNSQVVVVAAESGIEAKADLAGRTVAVQEDSSALAVLNNEEKEENIALRDSFAQLIEYADYNTAFTDLEQGEVDAVIMDIGVAQYQISGREEGAFVILEGEENRIAAEQYAVGFLLGNEDLRDIVQATLDEMAEDGTFMKIAREWGVEASVCLGK